MISTKHLTHYIALIAVLAASALALVAFYYDKMFQTYVVIAMACSYVCWGVVHHSIHKDLYAKVVVEYAAIALLGVVTVLTLLWGK